MGVLRDVGEFVRILAWDPDRIAMVLIKTLANENLTETDYLQDLPEIGV